MKLNEQWALVIDHGGMMTDIGARNMTQNGTLNADYVFDIHYNLGNHSNYIAQFMMMYVTFVIGNQTMNVPLRSCDDIILTRTPIQYDGAVPTFWCNITYKDIDIYPGTSINSTFDLTLCHHFVCGWNETSVKVEAIFGLSNVTLINPWNDTEFGAGQPYAVEIRYTMTVGDPNAASIEERIMTPTGHTNTSLEYNLTLENGQPVTLSKLTMKDDFWVFNASGSSTSIGFSTIEFSRISNVTHGFPSLVYKDALSIKSDPEITVFHDNVSAGNDNDINDTSKSTDWVSIIVVVGVVGAAVATILFVKIRQKKR
ncbi:MAG: hypothetical protein NT131_06555 [Methanomassiliicoccales archaeon]|nr:hypothetical protein [Methanomassiliicoccales archaeon]